MLGFLLFVIHILAVSAWNLVGESIILKYLLNYCTDFSYF